MKWIIIIDIVCFYVDISSNKFLIEQKLIKVINNTRKVVSLVIIVEVFIIEVIILILILNSGNLSL